MGQQGTQVETSRGGGDGLDIRRRRAPTHSARWHGISAWLASEHASTVQIDIALILVLVVTVLTRAVILGFHVIFVLLALPR